MGKVARKRVDIVSLKLVREGSIHYKKGNSRAVKSPEDVAQLAKTYLGGELDREVMVAVSLNTKNEPTNITTVSQGTLNASLVHPREVYKVAIKSNANSIIIFHNHPSGDTQPSREDKMVTKRLKEAGKILGIPMLDHVIIGKEGKYTSMRQEGLL